MKHAFIDVDGVLISWGYAESNNDDTKVEVHEDFDLEPGKWRCVSGGQWEQLDAAAIAEALKAKAIADARASNRQ